MRAAVLHGPGDLRVEDVPEPAGEVLVRVAAATACGTDVKMLRRAQAEALGARAVPALDGGHALVFEAVGRPEAWRAAVEAAAPGGTVVLVGGCAAGAEAVLPTGSLHYDEFDVHS